MHKIEFAIVDSNALSAMGLQRLLEDIIPMAEITVFHSFEALVISQPERFIHYFVASGIYFEHAQYFIGSPQRSIVLVHGDAFPHIAGLTTLNVCQDEKAMVKSLLQLKQRGQQSAQRAMMASKQGNHMPQQMPPSSEQLLSAREAEVAILLAKGLINKEVADRLNISLTTVITHRKNIMDKLKARSLADIIIHVVMSGLIGVDEL